MIPSCVRVLRRSALNAKWQDRPQCLPPPDGERPQLDQGLVEPRSEIEELVAQVWREVLKLDRIGVYDNFFDLGGHSLLATRVIARLQSNFTSRLRCANYSSCRPSLVWRGISKYFAAATPARTSRRSCRSLEASRCNCRLPNGAYGTCRRSTPICPPTTSRRHSGSKAIWIAPRWSKHSTRSSPAMKCCGLC